MADWRFPADTAVDPDAPVTSDLMYALRDNPVAIAEGAVGAPRIRHSAFLKPVAGITNQIGNVTTLTADSSNPTRSISVGLRPLASGTVTFSVGGSGGSGTAKVYVAGAVVLSAPVGATTTVNAALNLGDSITYELTYSIGSAVTSSFRMLIGNDAPIG